MTLRKQNTTLFRGMLAIGLIAATVLLLFAGPSTIFAGTNTWTARYWNNPNLQGNPVLVREEPAIDHDWEGLSPDPGVVNVDDFSDDQGTYNLKDNGYGHQFLTQGVREKNHDIVVVQSQHDAE